MTNEEYEAKIKELQANNADLVTSIGKLELANKDLVADRTALKDKLKDGSGDEALVAENNNLLDQLAQTQADKEELTSGFKVQLSQRDMLTQLNELGVKAHNRDALNAITDLVLGDADYEDGSFKFLKEDGTTRFGTADRPYSIQDKLNELKESDKGYLFVKDSGGGAQPRNGGTPSTNYKDMSTQDKVDYFNKTGNFPQG